MKHTIMVVDDEVSLLRGLRERLELEQFTVVTCTTAEQALQMLGKVAPAALVLDVRLPGMSGFDLCKKIRALQTDLASAPILFLTTVGDESYKVLGLELGGDDYLTKPFSPAELVARLRALIRRNARTAADGTDGEILESGSVELDTAAYTVKIRGEQVELSPKEFSLLHLLLKKKDRVLTRPYLMETVWRRDYDSSSRTIDSHIKNLRKKLGEDGSKIKTIESLGYKWEED
ncbi:MAG: response regulator transcription factor [Elusimicrobiaceae bacterium]|nr:response regulator transcription factor [Elusimicrobiaceae bacterium]